MILMKIAMTTMIEEDRGSNEIKENSNEDVRECVLMKKPFATEKKMRSVFFPS